MDWAGEILTGLKAATFSSLGKWPWWLARLAETYQPTELSSNMAPLSSSGDQIILDNEAASRCSDFK